MKKIIINKLVVSGESKPDATVEFKNGLNIISGDSDTGKTYILECIEFVFGNDELRQIPKSKGYTKVLLDVMIDNEKIIMWREITNKAYIYLKNGKNEIRLNAKYDKGDDLCFTNYIMRTLFDTPDIFVYINTKDDKTNRVTIKDLLNFSFIEEEKIIRKKSLFLSENYAINVKNKRLFQYVLSDISNSFSENEMTIHEKRTSNDGGAEALKQVVFDNKQKIIEYESRLSEDDAEKIDTFVPDLLQKIDDSMNMLEEKKKELINYNEELFDIEVQKNNTERLLEKYKRKLNTSEKILVYNEFLRKTPDLACPICNSNISKNVSSEDYEIIRSGKVIECSKLRNDIDGLEKNMIDICECKNKKIKAIKDLEEEIKELNQQVNNLNSQLALNNSRITKALENESIRSLINSLKEQNEELNKKIQNLEKPIKDNKNDMYKNKFYDDLTKFREILKANLVQWKMKDAAFTTFDENALDVRFNDVSKNDFGKGYRSLLNTAVFYSLLEFVIKYNRPHLGFLIVDTPLASFKQSQVTDDGNVDSTFMEKAMVESLSKTSGQVILLENKNLKYTQDCHYIEFSPEPNKRHGFFE